MASFIAEGAVTQGKIPFFDSMWKCGTKKMKHNQKKGILCLMCGSNVLSTLALSATEKGKRQTVGDSSSRIIKVGLLEVRK